MAAFLKAEELSTKECSESQIINEIQKMQKIVQEMQNNKGQIIKNNKIPATAQGPYFPHVQFSAKTFTILYTYPAREIDSS